MVRYGLGLPIVGLLFNVADLVQPQSTTAIPVSPNVVPKEEYSPPLPMAPLPPPQGQQCPDTCRESGTDSANWTTVALFPQLAACSRPLLLEFSLETPTDQPQFIRACDTWGDSFYYTPVASFRTADNEEVDRVVPQLAWTSATVNAEFAGLRGSTIMSEIRDHLRRSQAAWNKTVLFGSFGGATVGVYVGEGLLNPSAVNALFPPLKDKITREGIGRGRSGLIQACGSNRTSAQTFGVIVAGSNDLSTVQAAVRQWANGTCVDTMAYGNTTTLDSMPIRTKQPLVSNSTLGTNSTLNATAPVGRRGRLHARADCRTEKVIQNDGCGPLAARCGISGNDITKYNTKQDFCSTLMPGQLVCCGTGTLPDVKPKPNPDGSCAEYTTIADDTCSKIAMTNQLEIKDLDEFNKKTWGWTTCDRPLWIGVKLCVSKGTPPMPAPIANAVCGPQKPNTPTPPAGTNISNLNPCLLNACCNIWGQCGLTEDFCVDTRGEGAPGTAKEGTYGCISNCGMDIIKGSPPAQFIKLGYFEAFNLNRKCLNMDVSQMDSSYTHIHFAFGLLTEDFEVYLEDNLAKFQMEQFKKMKGPKRILSFGGWTFSAERPYYHIFRNGVKAANRNKLATNIAKYINDNGLDGVDIDWEYPGAPDIPGIPPPDDPNEGTAYAAFLSLLRSKLNKDKSLSIAAPASFWYLKQFPIKGIAAIVDYIVYMTYDLHGQWDATNKWANPGCPTGSCLRSQVNLTETKAALAMITKAGVPSSKIIVGVTSYGRSFQMVDPSCTGPDCLFTGGPDLGGSGAKPGRCTGTSGYISNAEIKEYAGKGGVRTWYDKASDSNIMTYEGDNWVAYMADNVRQSRTDLYKSLNMGGTTNWAVDLDKFYDPPDLFGSGIFLEWDAIKLNVKNKGSATACNEDLRTGNWVKHNCEEDEVTAWTKHVANNRWETLECPAAWNDAMYRWKVCDKPSGNMSFSDSVSQFYHSIPGNSGCDNLAAVDNCNPSMNCAIANSGSTKPRDITGACAYIAWNAMAQVHALIKNYKASLEKASNEVRNKKAEFVDTFAPAGSTPDYALALSIILTILQIPSTALGTFFWKGIMKETDMFRAAEFSLRLDLAKDSSQALVMAGYTIGQRFIAKATQKEVSFNKLYDAILGLWLEQIDTLVVELFDGSEENIKALSKITSSGQMTPGSLNGNRGSGAGAGNKIDHTKAFVEARMAERAFYSGAIPAVWKMRKPYPMYPVILDFGPDCNRDIGSGDFFHGGEDFNKGWVCLNNHNYILAGTYDRNNDGPNCSPEYFMWCNNPGPNWKPLFTLPGLADIQKPVIKWGNVTVEDLVAGSVATWERAGKLNMMDGSKGSINPANKDDFNKLWENDIRAPGAIRIPICNPKEAFLLASDGLGHGIPDKDKESFPCLNDPKVRYESEWIYWPDKPFPTCFGDKCPTKKK